MRDRETGGAQVLVVEAVSKHYGALLALDRVSFQVDGGEFIALLGPNGAGKTTLFQLLTGLYVADGGRILVEGHDIRRQAIAVLGHIGVVFQQPTLDLDMSVRDNLLFHAYLHGMRPALARERIREELDRLGLQDSADRVCRGLSGGNRRKVELARALLHRPRILFMDEATVGLDPASRSALVDYVHELSTGQGMSVLWATHLVDEAEAADRVLVLCRGRLIAEDRPAEIARRVHTGTLAAAFLELTETEEE